MSQETGPLSISLDTSKAKTIVPMPPNGAYIKVRLAAPPSQKTLEGKGDVLEWTFELAEETTDTTGAPLRPGGFGGKFFKSIYLYGKDGAEAALARAAVDVAKIQDALLGTGDPGTSKPERPAFNASTVPALIGLTCWCKVKHKTGDYVGVELAEFKNDADMKVA